MVARKTEMLTVDAINTSYGGLLTLCLVSIVLSVVSLLQQQVPGDGAGNPGSGGSAQARIQVLQLTEVNFNPSTKEYHMKKTDSSQVDTVIYYIQITHTPYSFDTGEVQYTMVLPRITKEISGVSFTFITELNGADLKFVSPDTIDDVEIVHSQANQHITLRPLMEAQTWYTI